MAHSALHFSLGWAVGSLGAVRPLVAAWRRGRGLAGACRRWLILSYALGALAVLPGILRWLGVPDRICDGAWMNVCVFYPLLNRIRPGAHTAGPLVLGGCFAAQYVVLLVAIARLRRRRRRD
jgi:hypothetical protein